MINSNRSYEFFLEIVLFLILYLISLLREIIKELKNMYYMDLCFTMIKIYTNLFKKRTLKMIPLLFDFINHIIRSGMGNASFFGKMNPNNLQ